ncbi:MAG: nucleotidyltransferase family protein [Dehalococcoidia bacterium]|nr:nucleotidyltransferase family protein [Dehalococcoidia bacterium]
MIGGILLAGGASTRMGSPKQLIKWGDTTLIEWEINELTCAGIARPVVVLGNNSSEIINTISGLDCTVVINSQWEQGRSTSLRAGARALLEVIGGAARYESVVIQNVDQPTTASIIRALASERARTDAALVQPEYLDEQGLPHGGHPVVLQGQLINELQQVTEEGKGLRQLVKSYGSQRLNMSDEPIVKINLNTPDLVNDARLLFRFNNDSDCEVRA